ncbi:bifunctional 2-polyprenyl-6-hydroxyphenol methylase/3-demethylubiquinol 3-O-methyltransferase UbiG [Saccharophagus sp. K07]|jgi:2-polyprenyl-6-hydroxyphenyl methylase/3-demethylubiquinone-9 3-methyltransferase|uniref:bifunctional 2-polyprenyl-6-hydroxyphenol methylase/3-demethylubiquinol 3-O-methyltransferase UbiG n=1 Tax=Saccharophagus sp. K07 TaxID=2283636 RepID=UPI001652382E|nr:bifunctional 2-polyprenyl-6-hydroxyphenol methylase/3-demethylubiquinol 3-O-methyltransferase UbiG [Saccharophagus sp. K07]MBC6907148.1 bifunctional 2-polyprenyl-6-hydroxyphenol methylase/3-demethylubiquinol 3-O-methyltransferase UbiG [Saccharophagus sp. K07]
MTEIQFSSTRSANVDSSEIAKFERMANRWWDPHGDFKPLHQMNPVRANYIDLRAQVAEKKLLDVGCGGGLLSEAMASRGAFVTGIDMGEAPLEVARMHAEASALSIDYRKITAEQLAAEMPGQFDVVTCLEMLEHVPDPAGVIEACTTLVKPGGHVFFSTLNRTPKAYVMAVLGAEYVLRWLPKGTHDYRKFIRPSELAAWSRQAGLLVRDITGIVYNPLTQTFKTVSGDVDVNYIMHLQKPEI